MGRSDEAVTVFEGKHLRARLYRANASRLFVSFDSFRPDRRGFDARRPVKFYADHGLAQIQIQTARNDWYLNDDLEPMLAALSLCVRPFRRVYSMAFSMGAFGALRMSRALRLSRVLLVSPQITPFSHRGPRDPRYAEHEADMRADLDLKPEHLFGRLRGCILFDPLHACADVDHARAIEALAPGLRPVALPFAGHPADKTLLEGKVWPQFQAQLLRDAAAPPALKALHRAARENSPSYLEAMSGRLLRRGRDLERLLAAGKGLP